MLSRGGQQRKDAQRCGGVHEAFLCANYRVRANRCLRIDGRRHPVGATESFVLGFSTLDDVVAQLGSPTSQVKLSSGATILLYSFASSHTHPESFLPIIGPLFAGGNIQSSTALLEFDENDVLRSARRTTSTGASTQPYSSLAIAASVAPEAKPFRWVGRHERATGQRVCTDHGPSAADLKREVSAKANETLNSLGRFSPRRSSTADSLRH
jgi:hypothetical protein